LVIIPDQEELTPLDEIVTTELIVDDQQPVTELPDVPIVDEPANGHADFRNVVIGGAGLAVHHGGDVALRPRHHGEMPAIGAEHRKLVRRARRPDLAIHDNSAPAAGERSHISQMAAVGTEEKPRERQRDGGPSGGEFTEARERRVVAVFDQVELSPDAAKKF